jgi:hypothetical protein
MARHIEVLLNQRTLSSESISKDMIFGHAMPHLDRGPCRYFVQSFYSSVHLNSIEVRRTLVRISNFIVHSLGPLQRDRGRSHVAISRIISRIGDTHIPWTLAGSHLRVTSITAWVICYLYSL